MLGYLRATTASEKCPPTHSPARKDSATGLSCANSVSADADEGFPGCGEGEVLLLLGGPASIRACGTWTSKDTARTDRMRASFRLQLEIPIKVGSSVQPSKSKYVGGLAALL